MPHQSMAASDDVKLIGMWSSPFSLRARIALNIKSINYHFLDEQFLNKSELLLKSNPVNKKVPVLLHNQKPICESLVIIHYIDKVWSTPGSPSILPSDPYEQATVCFWAAYIDEKWFPAMRAISIVRKDHEKNTLKEQVKEGISLLEEAFVECSKGKGFFGGEELGFLDIAFGCFLQWLKVVERLNKLEEDRFINETETPNLFRWAERFLNHSCVRDLIPDFDQLVRFAKFLFANLRALERSKL